MPMPDVATGGSAPPRKFLILALLLGTAYVFVNPPFAVNDEDVHMARIYELASGRLLTRSDVQGEYHYVPEDYRRLGARYQGIARRQGGRVKPRGIMRNLVAGRPEGPLVRMHARASGYGPIAYGLQLPVVWLLKHFNVSVLWHLYVARAASLGVYVWLTWRAVVTAGRLQWLFIGTALLPMALTQAAGVSADGLVISSSLLLFALIAKGGVLADAPLSPRELIALTACLVILSICKPVYAVAGLSFLCLRWDGPRRHLARCSYVFVSCALALGCVMAWRYIARDVGSNVPPDGRSPLAQLAWLLADPWRTFEFVARNTFHYVDDLLIESTFIRYRISHETRFVGGVASVLCLQLLVGLAWGAARRRQDGSSRKRKLHALILALTWLSVSIAVPSALYLCCNRVGAANLRSFHGRYLIPAIPPLLLSLTLLGRPLFGRWLRLRQGRLVLGVLVFTNLLCQLTIVGWHYFSPSVEWPL